MVGDHHLEVVEREQRIEVYPSDARRRPLSPVSGRIVFDGVHPRELGWEDACLVTHAVPAWSSANVQVRLADGSLLAIDVPRRPTGNE
jgi:hypothetical protein